MPADATGSTTQPEGSKGETPEYVTKSDLSAMFADLEGKLGKLVNGATTNHLSREMKKLGLTPETAAAIAKLTAPKPDPAEGGDDADAEAEREAQAEAKRAAKRAGKTEPQAAAGKEVDIEALLKKQATEMEANWAKRFKAVEETTNKRLAEERTKREQAERAQVELRGTTAAREALSKHVIPDAAGFAFDAIKARGHLHIADDGTPYYRANPADEDSQVPFADGVTEFLKSPGAKVFLPAPQTKVGRPPPKTPPLPQNGASASIHDKLAAIAAADGVDVEQALS